MSKTEERFIARRITAEEYEEWCMTGHLEYVRGRLVFNGMELFVAVDGTPKEEPLYLSLEEHPEAIKRREEEESEIARFRGFKE